MYIGGTLLGNKPSTEQLLHWHVNYSITKRRGELIISGNGHIAKQVPIFQLQIQNFFSVLFAQNFSLGNLEGNQEFNCCISQGEWATLRNLFATAHDVDS